MDKINGSVDELMAVGGIFDEKACTAVKEWIFYSSHYTVFLYNCFSFCFSLCGCVYPRWCHSQFDASVFRAFTLSLTASDKRWLSVNFCYTVYISPSASLPLSASLSNSNTLPVRANIVLISFTSIRKQPLLTLIKTQVSLLRGKKCSDAFMSTNTNQTM